MGLIFRGYGGQETREGGAGELRLRFPSDLQRAVTAFDRALGFDLEIVAEPPRELDGEGEAARNVANVVVRRNPLLAGRTYALFTRLEEGTLTGYIGLYDDGAL